MSADEIHSLLRDRWPEVLERLGIAAKFLTGRHTPCPACGGKDRFRFHNRNRHGDFYCNVCGPGDGFTLLRRVHGWKFAEVKHEVIAAGGLAKVSRDGILPKTSSCTTSAEPEIAQPSRRVRDLLRTSCNPNDVLDVVRYLKSRHVWPLPSKCSLRAHVGIDYFDDDRHHIGRFPALVAPVVDIDGMLITCAVTYLQRGQKLAGRKPRKLLGKLTGRRGCAIRLSPATDVLGVAEGIETALAAMRLHDVPVWAALNTSLLARFEPPLSVERLIVFADRDAAGFKAARTLHDRLGAICELCAAPPPSKDWADELAREVACRA